MHSSPRHRHFVALPLTVLMFMIVGSLHQFVSATASDADVSHATVVLATDEEKQFSFPIGATVLLSPQSRVLLRGEETLEVLDGSALVSASGFASIDAGFDAHATVLMGSMLAVRDAHSTSVVALTVPVIVSLKDQNWILTSGDQIRVDSDGNVQRSEVPELWLSEQIARSQSLPVTPLPESDDDDRKTMLARMIGVDEVLSASTVAAVFTLADTLSDSSVTGLVALKLASDSGRLESAASDLVTSRMTAAPFRSSERFTVLPALAFSSLRPLPQGLIELWSQDAIRSVAEDPVSAASDLADIVSLPAQFADAGYPKQSELWQTALDKVSAVLLPLLPDSLQETAVPEAADSSEEPVNRHSAGELIAITKNLLLQRGVLFSSTTTIEADDALPDCSKVSGIFLQESGQDIPYEFSLCPFEGKIRTIKRAGVLLPNAVSPDQFFR